MSTAREAWRRGALAPEADAPEANASVARGVLLFAVAVNALLGVCGAYFFFGFAAFALAYIEGWEDVAVLAGMIAPMVVGFVLLAGYWRAAAGRLRRPRLLWGTSLVFNGVGLAAAVGFIAIDTRVSLYLGTWALFMCLLSGYSLQLAVHERGA